MSLLTKIMRPLLWALFLCLLSLVNAPPSYAKKQLSISPPTLKLSLSSGMSVTGTVTIYNDGTEDLPYIFLYPANIKVGEKGERRYVRPSSTISPVRSPASWISFTKKKPIKTYNGQPYISLKPGERQDIEFMLATPQNAGPGDYNVVIFSEMKIAPPKEGVTLKLVGRVGCRIMLRIAGEIIEKMKVSSLKVKSLVTGNKLPYSFDVNNEGNIDHPGKVVMDILGSDGRKMKTINVDSKAYFYADTPREYASVANVGDLSFGSHKAKLVLRYDSPKGGKMVEKEGDFFVISSWLFWVIIAVTVFLILFMSFMLDKIFRSRKRKYRPKHMKT